MPKVNPPPLQPLSDPNEVSRASLALEQCLVKFDAEYVERIEDLYDYVPDFQRSFLGKGAFGEVHQMRYRFDRDDPSPSPPRAMKSISKKQVTQNGKQLWHFLAELTVTHHMKHPNLNHSVALYHTRDQIFIALEMCEAPRPTLSTRMYHIFATHKVERLPEVPDRLYRFELEWHRRLHAPGRIPVSAEVQQMERQFAEDEEMKEVLKELRLEAEVPLRGTFTPLIKAGVLPVAKAGIIVKQCLLGLAHLHAHGVVHRDVKTGNVIYGITRHAVPIFEGDETAALKSPDGGCSPPMGSTGIVSLLSVSPVDDLHRRSGSSSLSPDPAASTTIPGAPPLPPPARRLLGVRIVECVNARLIDFGLAKLLRLGVQAFLDPSASHSRMNSGPPSASASMMANHSFPNNDDLELAMAALRSPALGGYPNQSAFLKALSARPVALRDSLEPPTSSQPGSANNRTRTQSSSTTTSSQTTSAVTGQPTLAARRDISDLPHIIAEGSAPQTPSLNATTGVRFNSTLGISDPPSQSAMFPRGRSDYDILVTPVGTEPFLAMEFFESVVKYKSHWRTTRKLLPKLDVYGCGVMLYAAIHNDIPYSISLNALKKHIVEHYPGATPDQIDGYFQKEVKNAFSDKVRFRSDIPAELRDTISSLLELDNRKRPGADEALNLPFFASLTDKFVTEVRVPYSPATLAASPVPATTAGTEGDSSKQPANERWGATNPAPTDIELREEESLLTIRRMEEEEVGPDDEDEDRSALSSDGPALPDDDENDDLIFRSVVTGSGSQSGTSV